MMECNVAAFQRAIAARSSVDLFRYLEVGCARGSTVAGIIRRLHATRPGRWQAVALDKLVGGWEYGIPEFFEATKPFSGGMIAAGVKLEFLAEGMVFLNDDGSDVFLPACRDQFDLVLIDACHGKDCCVRDFQMVEPLVKPGGYVFFHDADPMCQGKDLQPHCQQTIGVRSALTELGLFDSTSPEWDLVEDIQPVDNWNRGCVVVKRRDKSPDKE
jgi:SAM-dependent methyltransferase